MANMEIIIGQMALMFLYMGIGFLLYRKKLITDEGSRTLANLILYVLLPCVIIQSFVSVQGTVEGRYFFWSLVLGAAVLLISMALAALFFRKRPIDNFGTAFSCAGFMGIPLILPLAGQKGVVYATCMVALLNILQWFYGQRLLMSEKDRLRLSEVLCNPLVLSALLGIVLFFSELRLPSLPAEAVSSLAKANTPLAMVVLGIYMGQADLKKLFYSRSAYAVSFVRLIVIPLATLAFLAPFSQLPYELRLALMTAACAPVGSNVAVYAQKQNSDTAYAVTIVCLSTLFSLVTMPVILWAAERVF